MAHRTFHDQSGMEWEVWDVIPDKRVSTTLTGGWLAFQTQTERRRLAPLPLYWAKASEEELCDLLERAKAVPRVDER